MYLKLIWSEQRDVRPRGKRGDRHSSSNQRRSHLQAELKHDIAVKH